MENEKLLEIESNINWAGLCAGVQELNKYLPENETIRTVGSKKQLVCLSFFKTLSDWNEEEKPLSQYTLLAVQNILDAIGVEKLGDAVKFLEDYQFPEKPKGTGNKRGFHGYTYGQELPKDVKMPMTWRIPDLMSFYALNGTIVTKEQMVQLLRMEGYEFSDKSITAYYDHVYRVICIMTKRGVIDSIEGYNFEGDVEPYPENYAPFDESSEKEEVTEEAA